MHVHSACNAYDNHKKIHYPITMHICVESDNLQIMLELQVNITQHFSKICFRIEMPYLLLFNVE